MYINDIPDLIKSTTRMLANDTKIYSVIKSFNDSLQDINRLSHWSSIWLLRFNAAKCKVMQIGNSLPVSYTMKDCITNLSAVLDVVNEEKDLGVWCTCDLKPSLHCQRAAVKVTQIMERNFKLNSRGILS